VDDRPGAGGESYLPLFYIGNTMRPLSFLLSILIHASLLLIITSGKNSKAKEKSSSVKISIVDKPTDKEIKSNKTLIPPSENKSKVVVKKKKKAKQRQQYVDHECEQWYSGIGVMNSQDGSCVITHVGKGYPADRAGIVIGDLILNDGVECPGRGPLGTHITVRVMRGTKVLVFNLVREKICEKDM
jgi:predicted metalloprotease with PDZ domain